MKLALVDDDIECSEYAARVLHDAGYTAEIFTSVASFKNAYQRDTFDIVFLDWVMPAATGIAVVAWLRQSSAPTVPVVMISSKAESDDIAEALDAGADDYVVKPVDPTILLARVKALLRRTYENQRAESDIAINGVVLNPQSGLATVHGEPIEITTKELELAYAFFANIGRPLARSYLLETIWGKNRNVITRTLDAHVSKIRRKLALRAENGFVLQTIYSYGYRLELIPDAADSAG